MRYVTPLALAGCLLAGIGTAQAADCHFDPYSFDFGIDTSTQLTVKSGKSCSSKINYRGGGASQISVTQPAANGTVLTPGPTEWQYVSRRGFTGTDHFVVAVTGESMGRFVRTGTAHITVDVNVVP